MQWRDFYDNFWDWSDSTRKTRISSLEDIGSGDEIVDVILGIEDEKVRSQLIRKAMKLGARFTGEDIMNLDGELPDALFEQVSRYAGVDVDDLYFDEDNMDWDDFYNAYSDWDEALCERRIRKLPKFGPPDEVCEAIQNMPSSACEELLYKKAVAAGVKFTRAQKEEMGCWDELIPEMLENALSDEAIDQFVANAEAQAAEQRAAKKRRRRIRFWGTLIGIGSGLAKAKARKKDPHHCDGDCDNCPAHYGYRYGRWYYGHGHQSGCTRGGNGGRHGKTYRD